MNNLATQLEEVLHDEVVEVQEKFVVDTLEKAVWLDEKAAQHEAEIHNIDKLAETKIVEYQAKIDRIKQWQEDQKKSHLGFLEWAKAMFYPFLERHVQEQVEKKKKKISKSIKLPFRTLSLKSQSDEWYDAIHNMKLSNENDKLVKWAEENAPELVKTKKTVDWVVLKDQLKINDGKVFGPGGEYLDFVEVKSRPDKYDWKVME